MSKYKQVAILLALTCHYLGAAPTPLPLSNQEASVQLDPATGRIKSFALLGQPSVLWWNGDTGSDVSKGGWKNFGGEKIWPGPQALWPFVQGHRWPPDPAFDGAPPMAIRSNATRSFTVTFSPSEAWQVQIERVIALDKDKPKLVIQNSLSALAHNPVPVQIWSVAQIPQPDYVMLHRARPGPQGDWANLDFALNAPPFIPPPIPENTAKMIEPDVLLVEPTGKGRFKIGTLRRWIAAAIGDTVFLQVISFDPHGCYPEASSLQFLQNKEYGEMEVLGEARCLAAGETQTLEATWYLFPKAQDERQVLKQIRELLSAHP